MITKLWVKNFRNIKEQTLELNENNHCYIYGDNNHGKTSILTAIFIAAKQKAVFDTHLSENIKHNEENAYIGLQIESNTKQRVYVKLDKSGKIFSTVNNKKESKKQANQRNIDYICADALHIFQKDPQYRRKVLDQYCCYYDNGYEKLSKSYERLLRQKNKYLKQELHEDTFLLTLNSQLAKLASNMITIRKEALKKIENELNKTASFKARLNIKQISLSYSFKRLDFSQNRPYEDVLLSTLMEDKEKEKILGYSLSGPQRDDFEMLLEGKSIFSFFSRGINRCYAVLFKIAQIESLLDENSSQCLLLDDAFAEIDQTNKQILLEEITQKYQVFYATTSTNDLSFFKKTKHVRIKEGEIING